MKKFHIGFVLFLSMLLFMNVGCTETSVNEVDFTKLAIENSKPSKIIYYDQAGDVIEEIVLEYDEDKNLIQEKSNSGIRTYRYEDGKRVEMKADYILQQYEYDDQDNLTKVTTTYFGIGPVETEGINEYDDEGLLIRSTLNETGLEEMESIYHYDDLKRIIQIENGDAIIDYQYDENGNCVKELAHVNGVLKKTTDYEYSKEADELKIRQITTSEEENEIVIDEYVFDVDGNFLYSLCSFDGGESYQKVSEYIY